MLLIRLNSSGVARGDLNMSNTMAGTNESRVIPMVSIMSMATSGFHLPGSTIVVPR